MTYAPVDAPPPRMVHVTMTTPINNFSTCNNLRPSKETW